ncbi:MAG TPA: phage baseplate assembly protein V [Geminicoccaceae bacterium]|jgi:uncharacterized protein involved in type VI secretion and phage assembly|nr:phage baseplate assembly protein V [Geminicoccaceae bacterium]
MLSDLLMSGREHEAEREGDGMVRGVAVAVVTDNRDPEGLARVRVRLPWLAESETSFWARIAVPMAGNEIGTYFLPEIGDEVLVAFEREDISHPYVIGGLWSGQRPPPEVNDGQNDRRLIRSRAKHELRFDDGASPTVEVKLSDGKHLVINDQGLTLEDTAGNKVEISSGAGGITLESKTSLTLRSQTISLDAGASMEIRASGTLTINGALVRIN